MIRIEHLELVPKDLKQFLDWSDIVIFTSQNTILPTINKINDIRIFDEKKIFAIGKKTRECLLAKKSYAGFYSQRFRFNGRFVGT